MLEPREFNLEFALVTARPPREDIKDQLGAIEYWAVPQPAEVSLLNRRELLVEDRNRCAHLFHARTNFFGLACAHEKPSVRAITSGLYALDHVKPR